MGVQKCISNKGSRSTVVIFFCSEPVLGFLRKSTIASHTTDWNTQPCANSMMRVMPACPAEGTSCTLYSWVHVPEAKHLRPQHTPDLPPQTPQEPTWAEITTCSPFQKIFNQINFTVTVCRAQCRACLWRLDVPIYDAKGCVIFYKAYFELSWRGSVIFFYLLFLLSLNSEHWTEAGVLD